MAQKLSEAMHNAAVLDGRYSIDDQPHSKVAAAAADDGGDDDEDDDAVKVSSVFRVMWLHLSPSLPDDLSERRVINRPGPFH